MEKHLQLLDVTTADEVELLVDTTGRMWLNVDGLCRVRIGKVKTIRVDLPKSVPIIGYFE